MSRYSIKAPDGRTYTVEGPAGATDEQVRGEVLRQFPDAGKAAAGPDIAKSGASGFMKGVAGLGDIAAETVGGGDLVNMGVRLAGDAVRRFRGKPVPQRTAEELTAPGGVSDFYSQFAHKPQTTGGEVAETVGTMLPNALAPGGFLRRAANVVLPAAGAEVAGRTAEAVGADERGQAAARAAGAIVGGGVSSVRPQNALRPAAGPVERLATQQGLEPNALRDSAQTMRDAGVQPSLVDVVGERGRRFIRAAGAKNETAGEVLTERANALSASTKPAAMAAVRRTGPRQGRTANEVAAETRTARDAAADVDYAPAYAEPISVTSETLGALSGEAGRKALQSARKAAAARRDEAQVAEIDQLLGAAPGPPPTHVSGATLDRVRIAMRELADTASRNGQGAYASGVRGRMSVIDQTLDKAPGLTKARGDYRAQTQAIDVLEGEAQDPFSTDPTDYARWLGGLSPQAREANAVAVRQDVLDSLGGKKANSFGDLDKLVSSPYAQENLRAAFGPEADSLLAEIRARLTQTRNAAFVQPNGGSRTAVLGEDMKNQARDAVGIGRQVLSADVFGLAARAADAWRSRGMSPAQAEELARMATDPAQTEAAIAQISGRLSQADQQEFLLLRNAAMVGGLGAAATSRRSPEEEAQR